MKAQQRLRARRGFTLAELLVVIAIIVVLVAFLLPAIQKARESANRAACASNLHQLGLAFHAYENSLGTLPDYNLTGASASSVHAASMNLLMCDGAVRRFPYRRLGLTQIAGKNDGVVPLPD